MWELSILDAVQDRRIPGRPWTVAESWQNTEDMGKHLLVATSGALFKKRSLIP